MKRETTLYRDGLRSLAAVDQDDREITYTLRDTDHIENTVFVFTSDTVTTVVRIASLAR